MWRLYVAAVVVGMVGRSAAAGPAELHLTGDACSLDTLEAEVGQLAAPQAMPTQVRVETTRDGAGVVAQVWFPDRPADQRGPRTVRAATCKELVESLALVIAMAVLDTSAAPASPEPMNENNDAANVPTSRAPAPADTATARANAIVRTAESPPPVTSLDFYAAGGSSISINGAHAQLLVGTRARRGARSLGLQLRADAPDERPITLLGSVRVLRTQLSVSPCLHLGALAGCGVASVGLLYGEGANLRESRSAAAPLASGGLRLTWEHALTSAVALRAYIEAEALLTKTQYDVDFMPVWTTSRIEGSGGLGLIARIL